MEGTEWVDGFLCTNHFPTAGTFDKIDPLERSKDAFMKFFKGHSITRKQQF